MSMTVLPPYMNRRRGEFYSAQLEELWGIRSCLYLKEL